MRSIIRDVIEHARNLERFVPRCELKILGDCTHSVLMEKTPEVRRHVLDWLAGAPVLREA